MSDWLTASKALATAFPGKATVTPARLEALAGSGRISAATVKWPAGDGSTKFHTAGLRAYADILVIPDKPAANSHNYVRNVRRQPCGSFESLQLGTVGSCD